MQYTQGRLRMAINKLVYKNQILFDLTTDDVTEDTSKVLSGFKYHGRDGVQYVGTGVGGGTIYIIQSCNLIDENDVEYDFTKNYNLFNGDKFVKLNVVVFDKYADNLTINIKYNGNDIAFVRSNNRIISDNIKLTCGNNIFYIEVIYNEYRDSNSIIAKAFYPIYYMSFPSNINDIPDKKIPSELFFATSDGDVISNFNLYLGHVWIDTPLSNELSFMSKQSTQDQLAYAYVLIPYVPNEMNIVFTQNSYELYMKKIPYYIKSDGEISNTYIDNAVQYFAYKSSNKIVTHKPQNIAFKKI